jgi:hypothetical protein
MLFVLFLMPLPIVPVDFCVQARKLGSLNSIAVLTRLDHIPRCAAAATGRTSPVLGRVLTAAAASVAAARRWARAACMLLAFALVALLVLALSSLLLLLLFPLSLALLFLSLLSLLSLLPLLSPLSLRAVLTWYPCFVVRVRFWGVLVRAGRATLRHGVVCRLACGLAARSRVCSFLILYFLMLYDEGRKPRRDVCASSHWLEEL